MNTENQESIQEFKAQASILVDINERAEGGIDAGMRRQDALCKAITAMSKILGGEIAKPHQIDANGELSLVCIKDVTYGVEFAAWLNKGAPRCGIQPCAVMDTQSSWCRMNHFSVEKIVFEFYKVLA